MMIKLWSCPLTFNQTLKTVYSMFFFLFLSFVIFVCVQGGQPNVSLDLLTHPVCT